MLWIELCRLPQQKGGRTKASAFTSRVLKMETGASRQLSAPKSYTKQRRTSVLQAGSFATAMEPQQAEYGQMASVRLGHARASLAMSGLNASSLVSGRATVQVFLSKTALALAMRPLTRWHGLTMLPRACSPAKDRAA